MLHRMQETPHLNLPLNLLKKFPLWRKHYQSLRQLLKIKSSLAPTPVQILSLFQKLPALQRRFKGSPLLWPCPVQKVHRLSLQDWMTYLSRQQVVKVILKCFMCYTQHSFLFVITL